MTPRAAYVALLIGVASPKNTVSWACGLVSSSPHPESHPLFDLAAILEPDSTQVSRVFREALSSTDPTFAVPSPEAERIARALFRRACTDYLGGRLSPSQICALVYPIEQVFDFPSWLGHLYDACDWRVADPTPSQVPFLAEEVAKLLRALPDDVPDENGS
jgi:hypothetical protein